MFDLVNEMGYDFNQFITNMTGYKREKSGLNKDIDSFSGKLDKELLEKETHKYYEQIEQQINNEDIYIRNINKEFEMKRNSKTQIHDDMESFIVAME